MMKNLIAKLFFGRDNRAGAAIAICITALIALGCGCNQGGFDLSNLSNSGTSPSPTTPTYVKADASKGELPSEAEAQEIAKTTLLDFNDAVQSGDFTGFHSRISKEWQKQNTPDKMEQTFKPFIDNKINISRISSYTAEYYEPPSIGKEIGFNTLRIKGRYKTSPNPVKFILNYIPNGKDWKLSKIIVDTTPGDVMPSEGLVK
jgi:hypothetical protein